MSNKAMNGKIVDESQQKYKFGHNKQKIMIMLM